MRGSVEQKLFGAQPAAISIGRFYVLERVGEGGMGVVYAVYDAELDRRVALKLLKGGASPQLQERLQREARALARLSHPNVVPVFEVGEHEGRLFIVLEFVRGHTLREWVAKGRRTTIEILDAYAQAGRGLAAAHAAGLVHRDFKPDNAVVDAEGRVRVLDFGLARTEGVPEIRPILRDASSDEGTDTPLTDTGSIVGTPAYMAPEQLAGAAVDHRSDQFAFCVALWEALTGTRPYAGKTVAELADNVLSGKLGAPQRPLHPALRRVLERGLRTEPDERWPSMDALLAALARSGRTRRRVVPLLGAAAIVVGGAVAWAALDAREDPCVDGAALLGQVWDETRRAAVRDALAAVRAGNAEATATIVDDALIRYAEAWQAGHRDACEAGLVERTQSRAVMEGRMRCLDDRRRALGAVVDVLAAADETVLQAAVRSVGGLPALDSCADLDYVQAEVPPPDDPEVAAEVDRIADELARAKALVDAAKAVEAMDAAQRGLDAARAIGHTPSLLHASTRVAEAHYGVAAYDASIAAALEGFEVADAGSRPYAIDNLLVLASSLHQLGRYAEALAYRKRALAMVVDLYGQRSPQAAAVLVRVGETLHQLGRTDEAEAQIRTMLAILEASSSTSDRNYATGLSMLGRILAVRGNYAEALELYERALVIDAELVGPDHPDVAAQHLNIAAALDMQGRYEEALQRTEQALAIQLRVWDEDHPEVASTRLSIGLALDRLGRYAEGLRIYEGVRDSWTRSLGPDHPNVAVAHANIGEALRMLGRFEEALRSHETALAIKERALGSEHVSLADSHAAIGNLLSGMGKTAEAIEHYEIGLRIELANLGAVHRSVALTREALGSALVDIGRHEEGLAHLQGSLSIFDAIGSEHPSAAWTHLALGRAVALREGCAAALPHWRRADAIWRKALGDEHPNLARPLAAIASCTTADERTTARDRLRRIAASPLATPATAALLALAEAEDEASRADARARLQALHEWTYAASDPR